jgi:hypothetical protein
MRKGRHDPAAKRAADHNTCVKRLGEDMASRSRPNINARPKWSANNMPSAEAAVEHYRLGLSCPRPNRQNRCSSNYSNDSLPSHNSSLSIVKQHILLHIQGTPRPKGNISGPKQIEEINKAKTYLEGLIGRTYGSWNRRYTPNFASKSSTQRYAYNSGTTQLDSGFTQVLQFSL